MENSIDIRVVEPGTVISVPTHIIYRHVGLVSDLRDMNGIPLIISNSPKAGGIIEETLAAFCGDRAWRYEETSSKLTPSQVIYRARTCRRQEYDAISWNCETFKNYCHGMPEESPQVAFTIGLIIAGLVLAAAARA